MDAHDRNSARTSRGEVAGTPPLGVENAELAPAEAGVSTIGETEAMRAAVAAENARMNESGSTATQRAYEEREAAITDDERERRAEQADIHNTPNDQHRND